MMPFAALESTEYGRVKCEIYVLEQLSLSARTHANGNEWLKKCFLASSLLAGPLVGPFYKDRYWAFLAFQPLQPKLLAHRPYMCLLCSLEFV